MKVSKAVSDKLKIGRAVGRAIDVRGAEVAEALVSILFPQDLPKQLGPKEFIEAFGATLERVADELEASDLAHAAELADDGVYREQRDTARVELVELLLRTRSALTASHGTSVVSRTGIAKALPRGNQELIGHARHVAGQLNVDALGEPSDELLPVNLGALRKRISAAADILEGSLSELERERREAQQTLERRTNASEDWSRVYLGVANGFMAFATMAGFDEIANRVKPTARRRAGRPEPEDEIDAAEVVESEGAGAEESAGEAEVAGTDEAANVGEVELDATGE